MLGLQWIYAVSKFGCQAETKITPPEKSEVARHCIQQLFN
jgi:hypothetical protein